MGLLETILVAAIQFILRLVPFTIPILSGYLLVHSIITSLHSAHGESLNEFVVGLLSFVFLGLPCLYVAVVGVRFDRAGAEARKTGIWCIIIGTTLMLVALAV